MRIRVVSLCVASLALFQVAASEPPLDNKYHVTAEERAACSDDAVKLCISSYPNEDALIGCMKANHAQLSRKCQIAFDLGLKKRRL